MFSLLLPLLLLSLPSGHVGIPKQFANFEWKKNTNNNNVKELKVSLPNGTVIFEATLTTSRYSLRGEKRNREERGSTNGFFRYLPSFPLHTRILPSVFTSMTQTAVTRVDSNEEVYLIHPFYHLFILFFIIYSSYPFSLLLLSSSPFMH